MVSSKILKSGISLALTASVALLAGCPTPVTTPTPSASPADSASPASPSSPSSPTSPTSPSSPSSPTSPTGSATPAPTISTAPSGDTGTTSDIKERATFNGKVYDVAGSPIESATVTATSIDPNVTWTGEAQQTIGGAYVFRNAPVGARIAITVTKSGYTTRSRTEVLKSNLTGDPDANRFDFGGSAGSQIYAIQDEPQVVALKINGQSVEKSGNAGVLPGGQNEYTQNTPDPGISNDLDALYPGDDTTTGTSSISRDKLEVEMTFSEPVIRSTVENNFKLYSERPLENRLDKEFSVDANYAGVTFTWSDDDTKVTVKADKPLWTTKETDEARYTISFEEPFEDKGNTKAKIFTNLGDNLGNQYAFFRFSTTQRADYATFSVLKDTVKPTLLSVSAIDNKGDEDQIVLNFSEPMDVINVRSLGVDLIGDSGVAADNKLVFNPAATFTQLGYQNAGGNDRVVYSITRVNSSGADPHALGADNDDNTATAPAGGNTQAMFKNVRLSTDGKSVQLTFDDEAFRRNERIIVSVGNIIEGDGNKFTVGNADGNEDLNEGTSAEIEDPAGNTFSDSNETTSSGVTVHDSQKVVTAAG